VDTLKRKGLIKIENILMRNKFNAIIMKRHLIFFVAALLVISFTSCKDKSSNSKPVLNYGSSYGTTIDTTNSDNSSNESSTMYKCPLCKGLGKVLWPNGYVTICMGCQGHGVITQERLNEIRNNTFSMNDNNVTPEYNNPQNQGRSRAEIAIEIERCTDNINSCQQQIQEIESSGTSTTLLPAIQNTINQGQQLLERLNAEYAVATH